ncbi:MAG: DUF190 domain-containing protein [Methanoregula sp.]|jgi:PII-like signaling protein|uniref:DUF190 domain-containing protein n=1 Tax=Methanoregula sp. TaxID=2052170 RepID=UPI003D11BBEA
MGRPGGFGHENNHRAPDVFPFSPDLPVIIDFIDVPGKIQAVLTDFEAMIGDSTSCCRM